MKLTLVKSLDEIKKEKDGYYDISALYGIIRGAMWCENNVLYIGQNLEYEVKEDSIQAIVDVVEQNKEEIEKELDNINGTHKLFELGKKIEAHMEDKRDALAKYGIKGINLGIGVREDEDYSIEFDFDYTTDTGYETCLYCYLEMRSTKDWVNEGLYHLMDLLAQDEELENFLKWKKVYDLLSGRGIMMNGWYTTFYLMDGGIRFIVISDEDRKNVASLEGLVDEEGVLAFDSIEELETMLRFVTD